MYRKAPYYFGKYDSEILVTNDIGNYAFLSEHDFETFTSGKLNSESEIYCRLRDLGFLYESEERYLFQSMKEYEKLKKCHFSSTQLFIIVMTNSCNQRCIYCQAGKAKTEMISIETCRKAIDIAAQSPSGHVTIEFQGGEPTLNPQAIRFSIEYARQKFDACGKKVDFSIVTNLTQTDTALLEYLVANDVNISTSVDGPECLHNSNRPLASGEPSFERMIAGLNKANRIISEQGKNRRISAIQTTTRESLKYPKEIVDTYLEHGFNLLYVRPLTPLGNALDSWEHIGYSAEEYLDFYRTVILYMLELCKRGTDISETTAGLYLSRIIYHASVGHTEFRSPCGAAVGQMAVNYDGNIYTCDEGRMMANMGDQIFRIGTVENTYKELVSSPTANAVCSASCVEALPFCSDCVYQPYCAACPVVNYGIEGDLISHNKNSYRCKISKGIISFLISLLKEGTEEEKDILIRWAN